MSANYSEKYPDLVLTPEGMKHWFIRFHPEIYVVPGSIMADLPEIQTRVDQIGDLFSRAVGRNPAGTAAALLEPPTLDQLLTAIVWLDLQRRVVIISFLSAWSGEPGKKLLEALLAADPPHRSRVIQDTIQIIARSETIKRMTTPIRMEALRTALEQPETFNRSVSP